MNSVNPLDLPSIFLDQRKTLPRVQAVYFVISDTDEILYIGCSVNLNSRWIGHHKLRELEGLGVVRIAWMEVSELSLLAEIEIALITHFAPRLNVVIRQNPVGEKKVTHFLKKKWVGGKRTINFSKQELDGLTLLCEETGRTETDILREALREKILASLKEKSRVN